MNEAQILHLAGLDQLPPAFDPQPFGAVSDPEISTEDARTRAHEHLPQLGPMFVEAVMQRFTELDRRMTEALERWSYRPTTFVTFAMFQTDSSGNAKRATHPNSVFLEPAAGFTMALHRLTIFDGAHTFGNPYTAAGAYWELRINDEMVDGGSLAAGAGQFPTVKTWGTRDAPHVRDGELGSLFLSGGPVSTQIVIKAQGTTERQAEA